MSEARDLTLELMGDLDMTQAEIARHLGRSPDMVRLVRQGKRPGNNLVEALRELRTTGHVSHEHLPPRRRRKDGKLAAVRAPIGDWTPEKPKKGEKPAPRPTAIPDDPTAKEQAPARRNRYAVDRQVLRGGVRRIDLHTPKKPDAKGRREAEETIMAELRSTAKSQSAINRPDPSTGEKRGPKKVKFYVTYENGHRVELGGRAGYYVSKQADIGGHTGMIQKSKESGGFFNWIDEEVKKGRPEAYLSKFAGKRVVNVEMTSFYQSKEDEAAGMHKKASMFG